MHTMPTTKDRIRPQTSLIFPESGGALVTKYNKCLWNGDYQQILWLGVNGFVVIDHEDREILLVDPWPTVCSRWIGEIPFVAARPLRNGNGGAKRRIGELASFLRRSRASGYATSAILLSHVHFDHADDVPLLLELLAAPKGEYRSRNKLDFDLDGPAVPVAALPVVCGDLDTLLYLKTLHFDQHWQSVLGPNEPDGIKRGYFVGQGKLLSMIEKRKKVTNPTWDAVKERYGVTANTGPWHEITWDMWSMFHDDVFNDKVLRGSLAGRRKAPGTRADAFTVPGSVFEVSPYVWDHMKTPVMLRPRRDSLDDQESGRYQRITAFLVRRAGIQGAKRSFFVGSAGEMGGDFTRPKPPTDMEVIETDVLVQAIQADDLPGVPDPLLADMMAASRRFTLKKIAVRDYLVFSHFEEFVRRVTSPAQLDGDFARAAGDTLKGYRELIGKGSCHPVNADLLSARRAFVLTRWGFGNDARLVGSAREMRAI